MREFLAHLIEPEAVRRARYGAFPEALELALRLACYRVFLVAALAATIAEKHPLFVVLAMLASLVAHLLVDRERIPTLQRNAIAMLSLLAFLPIALTTCATVVENGPLEDARPVLLAIMTRSLMIFGLLMHFGHKARLEYRAFLVLATLGMLISIARAPDPRMLICCVLYVAFTCQALALYGRWREHERRNDRTSQPAPFRVFFPRGRHAGSHAFVPSLNLSLHVLLVAIALFLAFPRGGSRRPRHTDDPHASTTRRERLSGFSENMELGAASVLKQNWEPAFVVHGSRDGRLRSLEALVVGAIPYWRGMAYANYDEQTGTWTAPEARGATVLRDGSARDRDGRRDGWIHWGNTALAQRTTVEYEIELRLARSRVLFGLEQTKGARIDVRDTLDREVVGSFREGQDSSYFFTDELGEGALTEGCRYVLRSEPQIVLAEYPNDLRTADTRDAIYRRVPPTIAFDRRFRNIVDLQSQALRSDHRNGTYSLAALQQVVTGYLHENYPYALGLRVTQSEDRDPILRFLKAPVPQRGGSCTYFASSMVMILRSMGVSARVVSGFAGYVPSGSTWIIAQAHAHAWVEVYCGANDGWVAIDPTPPAGVPDPPEGARDALAKAASEPVRPKDDPGNDEAESRPPLMDRVVDSLKNYDADSREELISGLLEFVDEGKQRLVGLVRSPGWASVGVAGSTLLLGYVLWRTWSRRSPRAMRRRELKALDPRQRSVVAVYDEMVHVLRSRGIVRSHEMTPRDLFVPVLERLGDEAQDAVEHVTFLFEDIRYGGLIPDEADLDRARERLRTLRHA